MYHNCMLFYVEYIYYLFTCWFCVYFMNSFGRVGVLGAVLVDIAP
jgi:hypothetical protein